MTNKYIIGLIALVISVAIHLGATYLWPQTNNTSGSAANTPPSSVPMSAPMLEPMLAKSFSDLVNAKAQVKPASAAKLSPTPITNTTRPIQTTTETMKPKQPSAKAVQPKVSVAPAALQPVNQPIVTKPVLKPTVKPSVQPVKKTVAKPAHKPVQKSVLKPLQKPVQNSAKAVPIKPITKAKEPVKTQLQVIDKATAKATPQPKPVAPQPKPVTKVAELISEIDTVQTEVHLDEQLDEKASDNIKEHTEPQTKQQAASTQITVISEAAKNYPSKIYQHLAKLRQRKVRGKGTVVIEFEIKPDGSIAYAKVAQSSGRSRVDKAALNHVRRAGPFPTPPEKAMVKFSLPIKIN